MAEYLILEVSNKLLQHLDNVHEGKSGEELLKELNAIPEDRERVESVKAILKNFQLPELKVQNKKVPECVETEYLESARVAMLTHDLEFALAKVNKGLAHIPSDQEGLRAKALTVRSEILLRMRQFSACVSDVHAALACTLDPESQIKLKNKLDLCLKYMAKASQPTKQEADSGDSEREICELAASMTIAECDELAVSTANPLVPCVSDALKLEVDSEDKIHRFVATREINAGEILISEEPLVSFLNPDQLDRCCFCMHHAYNLIPCDTCQWEVYCSERCKGEAKDLHSKECALMPALQSAGVQFNMLNLMKLKLAHDITKCQRDDQLGYTKPLLSSDPNSLFLQRPIPSENKAMLTLFFTLWARLLGYEEQSSDFDQLVLSLGELVPRVSAATFSIDQVVPFGGYLGEDSNSAVGLGVYPVTALVSHACSPNTTTFCVGRRLIMQATRLIPAGSLVTQCLYPEVDFLKIGRALRQSLLQDACFQSGGLECKCEACEQNWDTLDKLDSCDPQDQEVAMLVEAPLTADLLPHAFLKAEEMELRKETHTKEFHLLQERIRMAVAKQGNVSNIKPKHALVALDEIFVD
ncbi:Hypothetical predicted protein [Cloeon dipterum]|uniref:MYND-type domain-containing protein n=1 Tax=Cloeon dipterum TaxID=197152 RepID=A0A8S1CEU5_9INSE|nr:Hypothetical predicted protein [Cloeon dipterum]